MFIAQIDERSFEVQAMKSGAAGAFAYHRKTHTLSPGQTADPKMTNEIPLTDFV